MDFSKLAGFVAKHFAGSDDERRVGRLQQYLAGYVDIVRFFGSDGMRPTDIHVHYLNQTFEIPEPVIREFALRVAAEMRVIGRIFDGPPVMKLASSDLYSNAPHITVQPCDYALQAGTCFALDLSDKLFDPVGGTLRDYYRRGCIVPSVDTNPLAICLGVCGMLVVDERGDRFVLQVARSSRLASFENTHGPSVAGVVDYVTGCHDLAELIEIALGEEVQEELGLKHDDYEIVPLAWATELFRGERPQIFCLIRTLLNRSEIAARLASIPPEQREFDDFAFVPLYGGSLLDRKDIDLLNPEAKMNYFLLEEYLDL